MKFSEKYKDVPVMGLGDNTYLRVEEKRPCIVCGSPTQFVEINYDARLCSEECEHAFEPHRDDAAKTKYFIVKLFNEELDAGNTHPSGICLCSTCNEHIGMIIEPEPFDSLEDAIKIANAELDKEWERIHADGMINDGWHLCYGPGAFELTCSKDEPDEHGITDDIWLWTIKPVGIKV